MAARPPSIAATIRRLLHERGPGKSICPSEVARAVAGNEGDAWRSRMPAVRQRAARMAALGEVVVTQHGERVDIREARGPVRIALPAPDVDPTA